MPPWFMRRIPVPWFQVDDQLSFHPKAVRAGNGAMGLWVRAGSWCAQHLTGGFIPRDIARSMGTAAQINKLVEVVLWTEDSDGYQFHQWSDRQISKEELQDRRRKRAEAGRKGGQKSGQTRRAGSKNEASASANGSANASRDSVENVEKISESQNKSGVYSEVHSGTGMAGVPTAEFTDFESQNIPSPAEMIMSGEANASANASASAEAHAQAEAKQNRTPVPVLVLNSGGVGGNRYVSNALARTKNERGGPPKYHRGHPDGYVRGCADCETLGAAYEAWLVDLVNQPPPPPPPVPGTVDPEPSPFCPRHPGVGTPDGCGGCAAARQEHAMWQLRDGRRRTADNAHRRELIEACALCDDTGWRHPPPELADAVADLPAKCDHTLELPAAWLALDPTHSQEKTRA